MNALDSPRPAQGEEDHDQNQVHDGAHEAVHPDGGDAELVSTPDFCRNRAFSAIPPTLAGETRLTNDEAAWASTVGQNRIRGSTAPISATALAR